VTLRTGDIIDNATFGPDIKGDWDATDIVDIKPADAYTGDKDTWPSDISNPTSRLDRIYYTDSCVRVERSFVLNTRKMSSAQLAAAGLQYLDNQNASDHLPVVADFVILPVPVTLSNFILD
jgi:endonuclease/exonuclease/phosphatase family metal-dependent hydrolase